MTATPDSRTDASTDAPGAPPPRPALTKIVATVGPASSTPDRVAALIEAGVSIFRLNFGHGSLDEHRARLETIRAVALRLGRPTAVLGDLQGPKIRVGAVAGDGIELLAGATVVVQRAALTASAGDGPIRISTTYDGLVDDVKAGHRVLVNDGAIRMLAVATRPDEVECTVTTGGTLTSSKGINLPDTELRLDTLTERDWEHVAWSVENGLDFLALSFVRRAADVIALRQGIERIAAAKHEKEIRIPIVAKIEVPKALEQIDSIVDASDAIMVARGDLGVEMDLARVPVIQKKLIACCAAAGTPCIVATQMLESMIHSPVPTRAEANDVAGAIFDMTDAVMLSGETAVGKYPVIAVESMRRIADETERFLAHTPSAATPPRKPQEARYHTAALAHGAFVCARDVGAACVVVWSQSGGGARYLSQNGFDIPIVAFTSEPRTARQMQVLRGVTPLVMEPPSSVEALLPEVDRIVRDLGFATAGDAVVVVAGEPLGVTRSTDRVMLVRVGD